MEEAQIPLQVSVLIVSYNCAAALRRCLQSLEQSAEREKLEIIVVDNGSQDESPGLDAEFPAATFLRLPRNFGFTKAVNIGMRTAKAEFFFFLDPHTEVLPETVASLAARLAEEPDAVAVCPLLAMPEGEPAPQFAKLPDPATVSPLAWAGAFGQTAAPDAGQQRVAIQFASLEAFMARGYFLKGLRYIDERYAQSWADAEICVQIRRAARKVLLFPAIRVLRQAEEEPEFALSSSARALLSADWVLGAATYAGKHFGFLAGLKIRIAGVFRALGQALFALLRFRDVGYHFSRFTYILSGQKIDGTQTAL